MATATYYRIQNVTPCVLAPDRALRITLRLIVLSFGLDELIVIKNKFTNLKFRV